MKNAYYLPIRALNLAHYFASALIKPVKYTQNRNVDIQDLYPLCLLLSKSIRIHNMDCSLEIILTSEESKQLQSLDNNYYLLNSCLPISRIKKVIFFEQETRLSVIKNIEINTAFIPRQLIEIATKPTFVSDSINRFKDINSRDLTDQIRQYDRILGALALMRIATNYSENYFCRLARYNKLVKNEVRNYKDLYLNGYYDLLNRHIKEQINLDILKHVAKQEQQEIDINPITQIIDVSKLKNATYVLAMIALYKVNDADEGYWNIDSLIINRFQDINNLQAEEFAFYYGLNKGYTAFVKRYGEINFKFELSSQLDYYTIESVFQSEFNSNRFSGKFKFLDTWCPRQDITQSTNELGYYILDKFVIEEKQYEFGSDKYIDALHLKYGINTKIIKRITNDAQEYFDSCLISNIKIMTSNIGKILFDEIDKNRNGVLEADEVRQFIEYLYTLADKNVKDIIIKFSDTNQQINNTIPKKRKSSRTKSAKGQKNQTKNITQEPKLF